MIYPPRQDERVKKERQRDNNSFLFSGSTWSPVLADNAGFGVKFFMLFTKTISDYLQILSICLVNFSPIGNSGL